MTKLTGILNAVRAELLANGFTADEVFKHHAPPDKDHVLLFSTDQRDYTTDGLENYFKDIVQIVAVKEGTIEDMITYAENIVAAVVGTHSFEAGSPLVQTIILRQSSPIRRNSKQWEWTGLLEVTGCL